MIYQMMWWALLVVINAFWKKFRSSLIWWVISYFEPDRWPNRHAGIILPAIWRMGHSDIFSILYPHSDCVIFFLNWLILLLKNLLLHVFLFLFVKSFILFHFFHHKCCKLDRNLPWEDRDESETQAEQVLGLKQMLVPISAGILSALRRVIARRVSIKVVTFM